MKKNKWLIIPIILNLLVFFIVPASAADQFVSFDFSYEGKLNNTSSLAYYNLFRDHMIGMSVSMVAKDSAGRGPNNYSGVISFSGNDLYIGGSKVGYRIWEINSLNFTSNDFDLYNYMIDSGFADFITPHYRFVLDYFPTDVLSFFFYRFFENNYILWSIGIWILAIAFKMIFSTSGVLRCTRGF